jgi:hypothetical protein
MFSFFLKKKLLKNIMIKVCHFCFEPLSAKVFMRTVVIHAPQASGNWWLGPPWIGFVAGSPGSTPMVSMAGGVSAVGLAALSELFYSWKFWSQPCCCVLCTVCSIHDRRCHFACVKAGDWYWACFLQEEPRALPEVGQTMHLPCLRLCTHQLFDQEFSRGWQLLHTW